jgi:hypothetical protein
MNVIGFVQLHVMHSGRTTHKIIAEMSDEKWLDPERHEELKESLHAMAARHDWTLEGREIGPIGTIPYSPNRRDASLPADTDAGLKVWEIIPA